MSYDWADDPELCAEEVMSRFCALGEGTPTTGPAASAADA